MISKQNENLWFIQLYSAKDNVKKQFPERRVLKRPRNARCWRIDRIFLNNTSYKYIGTDIHVAINPRVIFLTHVSRNVNKRSQLKLIVRSTTLSYKRIKLGTVCKIKIQVVTRVCAQIDFPDQWMLLRHADVNGAEKRNETDSFKTLKKYTLGTFENL